MRFDELPVIDALHAKWGWILPQISTVLAVNSMGNVLLVDHQQCYWRICPEELSAQIVARTPSERDTLFADSEAKADWQMSGLVQELIEAYGEPEVGVCFGLVLPAVLGGHYSTDNIRKRCLYEYLGYTGDLARQTKDLKDGDKVRITSV